MTSADHSVRDWNHRVMSRIIKELLALMESWQREGRYGGLKLDARMGPEGRMEGHFSLNCETIKVEK